LLSLTAKIRWTLDTTRGAITIALDPTVAPWNTAALVGLAGQAFYGGVSWHRVVPGFVVQGGDPSGTGWGGPGFSSPGEPSWRSFGRGAVGIADAGPDTGGSQFFIMQARAPHLEGRYTWVGEVIDGMDVVDRLTTDDRVLSTIVDVSPRFEAVVRSP
jgi:cyclophilin family peptidyl-prolyl cis-trans isomerase